MSNDYKVGKGRPPLHSRFKPGQSGNPRGRPKGVRRPDELLRKLLSRKVTIREGASQRTVTVLEAMFLGLLGKAMKGDHKVAELIFSYLNTWDNYSTDQEEKTRAGAEEFIEKIRQLSDRVHREADDHRP